MPIDFDYLKPAEKYLCFMKFMAEYWDDELQF
jgi:hypothetical protein